MAQVTVEEIVVTARRVGENLQDVPLQVSAFTAETMQQSNMVGIRDINNMAPGLNYQGGIGRTGSGRLLFRGLNTGTSVTASKGSIFLDGIFFSSNSQDIPFDYLERVEVMPGPQSALFGRSTFGGALNFVTKDPTEELRTRVKIDIATLGEHSVNAYVAGPVFGEKLLGQAFLGYENFTGPADWRMPPNILHPTGIQPNTTRTYFGAGKLVFNASDDVSLEVGVMHAYDHDGPFIVTRADIGRANGFVTRTDGTTVPVTTGLLKNGRGRGYPDLATTDPQTRVWAVQNWYNIPDVDRRTENWRPTAELTWDVMDHTAVLTAFHEYEWSKNQTQSGGTYTTLPVSAPQEMQKSTLSAHSLELRVNSPSDQRLRYSFGAYYLKSVTRQLRAGLGPVNNYRCNTVCDSLSAAALYNPIFVPSAPGSAVGTFPGYSGVFQRLPTTDNGLNSRDAVKNKSVFATLSYEITETINLDLEGRYQADQVAGASFLAGGFNRTETFKRFLPRVNAQYKFDEDKQAYALFSIGNNPGSFNTSAFIGDPGTNTTEEANRAIPEELLYNYEIGLKATWLGGQLVTNLAAFHMNWKGMVSSIIYPDPLRGSTLTLRGSQGSSKVDGFAAEVTTVPIENLNIRATLSYTRSVYTDWCSTNTFSLYGRQSPGRLNCFLIPGNVLENVPPWSGSANFNYTHELVGDWNWLLRGTFQYQDGQYESDMNLLKSMPGYIFNFNAGIERESLTVEVYCSNCTDETAYHRIVRCCADPRFGPNAGTNGTFTGTMRKPRTVGFRATYTM